MNRTKITIEELVKNAHASIAELGYAEFTAEVYLKSWNTFKDYAEKNEIFHYSTELFLLYVEEKFQLITEPNSTPYRRRKYNHLLKLDEYYKFGAITSARLNKRKTYCFDGCFRDSILEFLYQKSKVLSDARIQSYKLYLERFCAYFSNNLSLNTSSELCGSQILEFIENCKVYTKPTVYATVSCLRQYLDYLYFEKIIDTKLSSVLPKINNRKQKEIPSAYSQDEIEKLLSCFNLENPRELRDYTMVLIAARLGLRASDICSLKFNEIDWERNTITIIQQKTKKPATYPLLKNVGEAIISYIKTARPKVDNEHIFIRLNPPYTRLNNGSMYTLTEKYFTRADINIPAGKSRGPHALRHSLSSMLLENNVPLPVISEILAHESSESTKVYLKIAEKQLKNCALSVPLIESEGK